LLFRLRLLLIVIVRIRFFMHRSAETTTSRSLGRDDNWWDRPDEVSCDSLTYSRRVAHGNLAQNLCPLCVEFSVYFQHGILIQSISLLLYQNPKAFFDHGQEIVHEFDGLRVCHEGHTLFLYLSFAVKPRFDLFYCCQEFLSTNLLFVDVIFDPEACRLYHEISSTVHQTESECRLLNTEGDTGQLLRKERP